MAERELSSIDFPSNSHKEKQLAQSQTEEIPIHKVERVVSGKVKTKKKSISKRFMQRLLDYDGEDIKDHLLDDVVFPGIRNMIFDSAINSLEMLLFNRTGRYNHSKNKYHAKSSLDRTTNNSRKISRLNNRHELDDIVLESRGEAEEVLDQMDALLSKYEVVTVADLKDLVGMTSTFVDNKYGWTNLSRASVKRDYDGFVILMPPAEEIRRE